MWRVSFLLAPIAGGLYWAGAPLWLGLAVAVAVMFAVFAKARAARLAGVAAIPVTLVAAVAVIILHHAAGPVPPGPAVVAFGDGQYTSYGTPSFTVDAANNGTGPATVHTIRVRFVNDRTAQVITEVTEPVAVTIQAGQGRALTYSAPRAVAGPAGPAVIDRDIAVTVMSWS